MRPSSKPAGRHRRGAIRRQSLSAGDRWLNHALDIAVISALLVGSVALGVTLLFD